jgi:CBS domain-containing protein/nitroimidazol reductase NimA-like FMN-containing flavoprotein (pyridoxamine 5'-phosphate oxidase superfamily)
MPLMLYVRDVMTADVVTVASSTPLPEVVDVMLRNGISGVPVVDDGVLVGIVTEADLVSKEAFPERRRPLQVVADMAFRHENYWAHKAKGQNAGEIMSQPVRTVHPDEEVRAAAARMVIGGIKRLPVVDDGGRLVGIVTRRDVLRRLHEDTAEAETAAAPMASPLGEAPVEARTGLTVLYPHQCWELLRGLDVGRLAVAIDQQPDIFPVNYIIDHGTIVFRTAEGTKLAAAVLGRGVAFEVDGYEPAVGEAWSVVVKGRAVEIAQIHELLDATNLALFPWHAWPKPRFVRIEPVEISGRRFHAVLPPTEGKGGASGRPTAVE